MERSSIVKSLTPEAIRTIRESPQQSQKAKVILQFLESANEGKSVYLSDGEFKQKFMVLKTLRPTLHMLKCNDVIECAALNYEGKMNVLVNYTVIYTDVVQKVGDPVEYDTVDQLTYMKRPAATNLIPTRVWQEKCQSETIVTNSSKMMMFKDPSTFTKISHLTPSSLSWAIRARVGAKTNIISYPRGKMFKCLLFDESASIEITFYGDMCDRWFSTIHERKCYIFTGADVKPPSKYNQTGHQIELNFGNRADTCEYLVGGDKSLPMYPPVIENLYCLKKAQTSRMYSFMAVPISVGKTEEFTTKFGKTTSKTEITVVDQDKTKILMNIWGTLEGASMIAPNKVIVFENFKVNLYQGNLFVSSTPLSRVHDDGFASSDLLLKLMNICELTKSEDFVAITNLSNSSKEVKYVDLKELQDESSVILTDSSKQLAFTTTAYVSDFGSFLYYDSCPREGCSRKIQKPMAESDCYECPRCGLIESHLEPIPKFMGQVKLTDHKDSVYATYCSDITGQTIFGCSVGELKAVVQGSEYNPDFLKQFLDDRKNRYYKVVLFPKRNEYQGELSVKHYISTIHEANKPGVIQTINEALLQRTTSLSCKSDSMLSKRDPLAEDMAEGHIDPASAQKHVKLN